MRLFARSASRGPIHRASLVLVPCLGVLGLGVVQSWTLPPAPPVARPWAPVADPLTVGLAVHLEAARDARTAAKGHACAESLPSGVIPAGFVVRNVEGAPAPRFEPFDTAWTLAQTGDVWIVSSCAR